MATLILIYFLGQQYFTINDQFNSGEIFTTRWTAKGTNSGPFGEMQATGKEIEIEGLIIDYVVNGRVAKRWELWEYLAKVVFYNRMDNGGHGGSKQKG